MGFLSFLEKPFRTGKSAADRAAGYAQQAQQQAQSNIYGMIKPRFDAREGQMNMGVEGKDFTLGQLLGDLKNGIQANEMPELPGIQSMSDEYINNRANLASQRAGQPFANADLNAMRNAGSRGISRGSGNLGSMLTGAGLAQAKAQSAAGLNTFNALEDANQSSIMRQNEANDRTRFNYDISEQDRIGRDTKSLQNIFMNEGNYSNPYLADMLGYYQGNADIAANNANYRASQVKPGWGTQALSGGLGSWAGGGFKTGKNSTIFG